MDFQEVGERIRQSGPCSSIPGEGKRKQARLRGKSPEYQRKLERQTAREEAERERRIRDHEHRVEEARSILRKLPSEDLNRLREIVAAERWLCLEELVEGLESEPEPVAPEPVEEVVDVVAQPGHAPQPATTLPAPSSSVNEPTEITELREWARSIGFDQLAEKFPANLVSKLEAFLLEGRMGGYDLHRALEAVRDDLAEGESR